MQWMDFIMPKYIKSEISSFIDFFMLVSLFLFSTALYADVVDRFIVENATLNPSKEAYLLNANIQYQFSDEALKALKHGVALQIDVEVWAKQSRKWMWDRTIHKTVISHRLEHHPLSNQYLITYLSTGIKHHFQNLDYALEFLGTIRAYPLFGTIVLKTDTNYTAQIRACLNTASLPTPLRLSTYIASDWQLSSPWFRWAIQQ